MSESTETATVTEKKIPANITKAFNAGVKAKMNKDGIVMKIASECEGVSITQAISYYNKLGKQKGIILSNDEKREKIDAELDKCNTDKGFDREKAKKTLVTKFDMTESTASNHLRRFCKDKGIELPSAVTAKAKPEEVQELVKAELEAGKGRPEIIKMIADKWGYSENTAGSHYAKAAKELGIVTGRSSEQRANLIQYFLQNGEQYDRKTMVAGLMEHFKLSEATANSYYGNYLFAKEFHMAAQAGTPAADSEAA